MDKYEPLDKEEFKRIYEGLWQKVLKTCEEHMLENYISAQESRAMMMTVFGDIIAQCILMDEGKVRENLLETFLTTIKKKVQEGKYE